MTSRRIPRRRRGSRVGTTVLLACAVLAVLLVVRAAVTRPAGDPDIVVARVETGAGFRMQPALARDRDRGFEAFSRTIERLRPYAAVNGTFYDTDMHPLGDILIDGRLVNRGHYRTAVAVTSRGRVVFLHRRRNRFNWAGYVSGLSSGPLLVHRGRISLDPVAEGFSRRSTTLRATRSGVGITRDGDLLMVASVKPLTFAEFAEKMVRQGAVEAMNLDGGRACGLFYRGKMLAYPMLPMTNVLVVESPGNGRTPGR